MRGHRFDLASTPLTRESLRDFDCIIIATNHDAFDYELIRETAKLIVDTRGVYRAVFPNVIKA
jgi:UDP-N-acetyl-D-glucosamine dehydrogenase